MEVPTYWYAGLDTDTISLAKELSDLGGGDARTSHAELHYFINDWIAQSRSAQRTIWSEGKKLHLQDCSFPPSSNAFHTFDTTSTYRVSSIMKEPKNYERLPEFISSLFSGYNMCILTYGDRYLGKSAMMFGAAGLNVGLEHFRLFGNKQGFTAEILSQIFDEAKASPDEITVAVSAWCLRGSAIIDLLSPTRVSSAPLEFAMVTCPDLHTAKGIVDTARSRSPGCCTQNNSQHSSSTGVAGHAADDRSGIASVSESSRAHFFLRIAVHRVNSNTGATQLSHMHVVDLVGGGAIDDREFSAMNEEDRICRREIHLQLHTLKKVLKEMRNQSVRAAVGDAPCNALEVLNDPLSGFPCITSARESKLTSILAPILQGNCRTVVFAFVQDGQDGYASAKATLNALDGVTDIVSACHKETNVNLEALKLLPASAVQVEMSSALHIHSPPRGYVGDESHAAGSGNMTCGAALDDDSKGYAVVETDSANACPVVGASEGGEDDSFADWSIDNEGDLDLLRVARGDYLRPSRTKERGIKTAKRNDETPISKEDNTQPSDPLIDTDKNKQASVSHAHPFRGNENPRAHARRSPQASTNAGHRNEALDDVMQQFHSLMGEISAGGAVLTEQTTQISNSLSAGPSLVPRTSLHEPIVSRRYNEHLMPGPYQSMGLKESEGTGFVSANKDEWNTTEACDEDALNRGDAIDAMVQALDAMRRDSVDPQERDRFDAEIQELTMGGREHPNPVQGERVHLNFEDQRTTHRRDDTMKRAADLQIIGMVQTADDNNASDNAQGYGNHRTHDHKVKTDIVEKGSADVRVHRSIKKDDIAKDAGYHAEHDMVSFDSTTHESYKRVEHDAVKANLRARIQERFEDRLADDAEKLANEDSRFKACVEVAQELAEGELSVGGSPMSGVDCDMQNPREAEKSSQGSDMHGFRSSSPGIWTEIGSDEMEKFMQTNKLILQALCDERARSNKLEGEVASVKEELEEARLQADVDVDSRKAEVVKLKSLVRLLAHERSLDDVLGRFEDDLARLTAENESLRRRNIRLECSDVGMSLSISVEGLGGLRSSLQSVQNAEDEHVCEYSECDRYAYKEGEAGDLVQGAGAELQHTMRTLDARHTKLITRMHKLLSENGKLVRENENMRKKERMYHGTIKLNEDLRKKLTATQAEDASLKAALEDSVKRLMDCERDMRLICEDAKDVRASEQALREERARNLSDLATMRERVLDLESSHTRGQQVQRFLSKHVPGNDTKDGTLPANQNSPPRNARAGQGLQGLGLASAAASTMTGSKRLSSGTSSDHIGLRDRGVPGMAGLPTAQYVRPEELIVLSEVLEACLSSLHEQIIDQCPKLLPRYRDLVTAIHGERTRMVQEREKLLQKMHPPLAKAKKEVTFSDRRDHFLLQHGEAKAQAPPESLSLSHMPSSHMSSSSPSSPSSSSSSHALRSAYEGSSTGYGELQQRKITAGHGQSQSGPTRSHMNSYSHVAGGDLRVNLSSNTSTNSSRLRAPLAFKASQGISFNF